MIIADSDSDNVTAIIAIRSLFHLHTYVLHRRIIELCTFTRIDCI